MYLTEDLANNLAFNATNDLSSNTYAEAIFLWLDHILHSASWETRRGLYPHSYILRVCDGSSGHWAKILKERLREKTETTSRPTAARSTPNLTPKDNAARPIANAGITAELLEHGWGFLEKWDSRPLGVASGS